MSLLIFNVFNKLRDSFPDVRSMLDFSWLLFTGLERFIDMAQLNTEHVLTLLQTTLLYARIEDEHELQINGNSYKQIEHLRGKIVETKKRIHSLAMNKGQLKIGTNSANNSNNSNSNNTNNTSNSENQMVRISSSTSSSLSRPASSSMQTKVSSNSSNNSARSCKSFYR